MSDDGSVASEPGDRSGADDSADALVRAVARAPAVEPPQAFPGRVAHFRIEGELGRGGMGIVYRAVDEALGRAVALKVLPPALEADEARRKRLLREARAAASVSHPNIATVYEVGESDARVYIAMELIEGRSLRDRIGASPLSRRDALDVASQIAAGLARAHQAGIIHRDLKPENVMVGDDGRVKILDFGLAKLVAADDASPSVLGHLDTVTHEEMILGTPAYMAPEQARGAQVTTATDVFAFGVMFFEMLTGARPPRDAAERAPSRHAELSPALRRLLERCLAPEPSLRVADGAALVGAIAAIATDAPARSLEDVPTEEGAKELAYGGPTSKRRRARIAAFVLVPLVLLAGAGLLGARALRPRPPPVKLSGLVRLEGGEFTMGRTAEEIDRECKALGSLCRRETLEREQPAHAVRIAPFYLDANEATNEDVAAWLSAMAVDIRPDAETNEPRYVRERGSGVLLVDAHPIFSGLTIHDRGVIVRPTFERKPAVQITWDGARGYCASRGKRLPTEAEWELAARGRSARRFPWGDEEPTCAGVVVGRDEGLPCSELPWSIASVDDGPMDFTPERVHAMGGGVSEWVEDAFTAPYYEDCKECRDPVQAKAPGAGPDVRVIRGGAWSKYLFTHATARGRWNRDSVAGAIGVRCALSISR